MNESPLCWTLYK